MNFMQIKVREILFRFGARGSTKTLVVLDGITLRVVASRLPPSVIKQVMGAVCESSVQFNKAKLFNLNMHITGLTFHTQGW